MIDSHCHIHMIPKKELGAVILRAGKAGVKKLITAACSLEQIGECLPLADEYENIWTTAGVHPTDLNPDIEQTLERVHEYARREEKIVAIGEIGLDYYHDRFDHDLQKAFLVGQLEIAKMLNLPAILHCRGGKNPGENEKAYGDLIEILRKLEFSNAVAHCFSGNKVEAEKLLDMGLMLSFTGVITYPENQDLRDIVRAVPLDRMMVETDSPFLAPQAHRGGKNEPAFVTEVAAEVAKIKNVPPEEVVRITTQNAERFFRI